MSDIHYVYRIINTINSMVYIGIHTTTNMDDGYMGSGVWLNRAQKTYGIENFTKEIIKLCDTRQQASDLEAELVTMEFVSRSDTYNIALGGSNPRLVQHTEATKEKLRAIYRDPEFKARWLSIINTEESLEKRSIASKNSWASGKRKEVDQDEVNRKRMVWLQSEAGRQSIFNFTQIWDGEMKEHMSRVMTEHWATGNNAERLSWSFILSRGTADVWYEADQLYIGWVRMGGSVGAVSKRGTGYKTIAAYYGIPIPATQNIINKFKEGWIPDEDPLYLDFKTVYEATNP
ncbi:homing endonuclease [Vibrio phage K369]